MTQKEKFWKIVRTYENNFKSWRYGQILFNSLFDVNPDLANSIRASHLDPFYESDRNSKPVCNFLEFINEKL